MEILYHHNDILTALTTNQEKMTMDNERIAKQLLKLAKEITSVESMRWEAVTGDGGRRPKADFEGSRTALEKYARNWVKRHSNPNKDSRIRGEWDDGEFIAWAPSGGTTYVWRPVDN